MPATKAWKRVPEFPPEVNNLLEELAQRDLSTLPSGASFLLSPCSGGTYKLDCHWLNGPLAKAQILVVVVRKDKMCRSEEKVNAFSLTRREKEIVDLMLQCKTNREIASELFISLDTVKSHCKRIFEKMGIERRSEIFTLLS